MERHDETGRGRLLWQCRRGMRELDELLGQYVRSDYETLDEPQRACLARLLEYPDALLLEILMGRMVPTDTDVAQLVERIRSSAAA